MRRAVLDLLHVVPARVLAGTWVWTIFVTVPLVAVQPSRDYVVPLVGGVAGMLGGLLAFFVARSALPGKAVLVVGSRSPRQAKQATWPAYEEARERAARRIEEEGRVERMRIDVSEISTAHLESVLRSEALAEDDLDALLAELTHVEFPLASSEEPTPRGGGGPSWGYAR